MTRKKALVAFGAVAAFAAGGWAFRGSAWADGAPAAAGKGGEVPVVGGCKPSEEDPTETICPFDKGPDTIDVSGYPEEQQANYKVFQDRCAKCHTLARPINAPLALPEEWDAYVTKMSKKKRSGVSSSDAKKIISFLTYDSSVRKKDLISQKLKAQKGSTSQPAATPDEAPKKDATPQEKAAP